MSGGGGTAFSLYKQAIEDLGEIRRAWFTSFNLGPQLVEDYLVPPLVGQEAPPQNLRELENVFSLVDHHRIDIRFFCDERGYLADQSKRSTVPIHLVNPKVLARPEFQMKNGIGFADGIFHPKVAFLQNRQGRAFLLTGSANLTHAGWGRNVEGVVVQEVKDRANAEAIRDFFETVFLMAGLRLPVDEGRRALGIPAVPAAADWKFISSFASKGPGFLELLLEGQPDTLAVWSPYFSDDLVRFHEEVLAREGHPAPKSWIIIPDIMQSGKIRIAQSQLESLRQNPHVSFHRSAFPVLKKKREGSMCHAKIWMSEKWIAVGSWNCTRSGVNATAGVGGRGSNNIEAGVFLSNPWGRVAPGGVEDFKLEQNLLLDPQEQQDEALDLVPACPWTIRVKFDWDMEQYFLDITGVNPAASPDVSGYVLKLPGLKDLPLGEVVGKADRIRKPSDPKAILRRHGYTLENIPDKIAWSGPIEETGTELRPAWSYENLSSLLISLGSGKGGDDAALHVPSLADDKDGVFEVLAEAAADGTESAAEDPAEGVTYFKIFQAFKFLEDKITFLKEGKVKAVSGGKQDTEFHWRQFLGAGPGNLCELADKIREAVIDNNPIFNPVQKWILFMETRKLIGSALEAAQSLKSARNLAAIYESRLKMGEAPVIPGDSAIRPYLSHLIEKQKYE